MAIEIQNRYYSVREVMSLLQISNETVYRWIRTGKLTAVLPGREGKGVGGRWCIDPDSLRALLSVRPPQ